MATETLQLFLKKAKPRENRVNGTIVFLTSRSTKDIKAANEMLFWKEVDKRLKDKGFVGIYPTDELDLKLKTEMLNNPELLKDYRKWDPNATEFKIPEMEDLVERDMKELQEITHRLGIRSDGIKDQICNRIVSYIKRIEIKKNEEETVGMAMKKKLESPKTDEDGNCLCNDLVERDGNVVCRNCQQVKHALSRREIPDDPSSEEEEVPEGEYPETIKKVLNNTPFN